MEKYLQHVSDQIVNAISYSAHQAGVVLTHLWVILVKQQIVLAIQGMSYGGLSIILALISFRLWRMVSKKKKMDPWDRNVLSVLFCVAGIWLLVSGLTTIIAWVPHLLNPEYYALQDSINILNQVRK